MCLGFLADLISSSSARSWLSSSMEITGTVGGSHSGATNLHLTGRRRSKATDVAIGGISSAFGDRAGQFCVFGNMKSNAPPSGVPIALNRSYVDGLLPPPAPRPRLGRLGRRADRSYKPSRMRQFCEAERAPRLDNQTRAPGVLANHAVFRLIRCAAHAPDCVAFIGESSILSTTDDRNPGYPGRNPGPRQGFKGRNWAVRSDVIGPFPRRCLP